MDACQDEKRVSVLVARRESAGLTIYKLAKLAGIKWETLRDIERRGTKPRQATLDRIEQALERGERHA